MTTSSPMSTSRPLRRGLIFAGLLALLLFAPAQASAAPSVSVLNQQRVANGIPPVEDEPSLADWCPNEDGPSSSGVVERDTVTGPVVEWNAGSTPFAGAPLHELSIYDPSFTAAGLKVTGGTTCVGMGWGRTPPPKITAPTFYAFVGPRGPSAVEPGSTVVKEYPTYNPLQSVGYHVGEKTGPIINLWGWVPDSGVEATPPATPVSWSLTSADGARVPDVRIASGRTLDEAGFAKPAIPMHGAAMAPAKPLAPDTTYTAEVTWQGEGGQTASQTFTFHTTAGAPDLGPGRADPRLRLHIHARRHGRLAGIVHFAKGDRGILRVGVRCHGVGHVIRLHIHGRRNALGIAEVRGRAPIGCTTATVIALIGEANGFRSERARPRRLHVR